MSYSTSSLADVLAEYRPSQSLMEGGGGGKGTKGKKCPSKKPKDGGRGGRAVRPRSAPAAVGSAKSRTGGRSGSGPGTRRIGAKSNNVKPSSGSRQAKVMSGGVGDGRRGSDKPGSGNIFEQMLSISDSRQGRAARNQKGRKIVPEEQIQENVPVIPSHSARRTEHKEKLSYTEQYIIRTVPYANQYNLSWKDMTAFYVKILIQILQYPQKVSSKSIVSGAIKQFLLKRFATTAVVLYISSLRNEYRSKVSKYIDNRNPINFNEIISALKNEDISTTPTQSEGLIMRGGGGDNPGNRSRGSQAIDPIHIGTQIAAAAAEQHKYVFPQISVAMLSSVPELYKDTFAIVNNEAYDMKVAILRSETEIANDAYKLLHELMNFLVEAFTHNHITNNRKSDVNGYISNLENPYNTDYIHSVVVEFGNKMAMENETIQTTGTKYNTKTYNFFKYLHQALYRSDFEGQKEGLENMLQQKFNVLVAEIDRVNNDISKFRPIVKDIKEELYKIFINSDDWKKYNSELHQKMKECKIATTDFTVADLDAYKQFKADLRKDKSTTLQKDDTKLNEVRDMLLTILGIGQGWAAPRQQVDGLQGAHILALQGPQAHQSYSRQQAVVVHGQPAHAWVHSPPAAGPANSHQRASTSHAAYPSRASNMPEVYYHDDEAHVDQYNYMVKLDDRNGIFVPGVYTYQISMGQKIIIKDNMIYLLVPFPPDQNGHIQAPGQPENRYD